MIYFSAIISYLYRDLSWEKLRKKCRLLTGGDCCRTRFFLGTGIPSLLFSDGDKASKGGKVQMGSYKNINQVFIVLGVFNFG